MPQAPVFLEHPSSLEHDTGSHPERAERMLVIAEELERCGWAGWERRQSAAVRRADLTAVHPASYVQWIEETALRGGGWLDADTVVSEGSFEAALHGAGGAVEAVDLLLDRQAPGAFSAHRPPGHHALADRAMGFCLFNNVAVAAEHAIRERELRRVLILDWDVHHGNGTNAIFHRRADVLFISIHQWPLYPVGSGSASDAGSGAGAGYSVNLPVPAGSGDAVFCSLVDHVAAPLVEAYQPQLILLSAGYDAHADDPLAGCTVTEAGFAAMSRTMREAGRRVGAPVGAVLEGGYGLAALGRSVAVTLEALGEGAGPESRSGAPEPVDETELSARARQRVARHWPALGS